MTRSQPLFLFFLFSCEQASEIVDLLSRTSDDLSDGWKRSRQILPLKLSKQDARRLNGETEAVDARAT